MTLRGWLGVKYQVYYIYLSSFAIAQILYDLHGWLKELPKKSKHKGLNCERFLFGQDKIVCNLSAYYIAFDKRQTDIQCITTKRWKSMNLSECKRIASSLAKIEFDYIHSLTSSQICILFLLYNCRSVCGFVKANNNNAENLHFVLSSSQKIVHSLTSCVFWYVSWTLARAHSNHNVLWVI